MPIPKVDVQRGPDHLASAGSGRRATRGPAAAIMARPLSGLFDVALEAKFTTSGTISTKARLRPDQLVSLLQSRDGPLVRPFFLHGAIGVTANASKKSIGITVRPPQPGKRPARSRPVLGYALPRPAAGIAMIRRRFYDLPAVMATLFRCL
jgi:hypothetical protein